MSEKPKRLVQVFFPFEVVDEVDKTVKEGKYENRSSFIRLAVRQKLALERNENEN